MTTPKNYLETVKEKVKLRDARFLMRDILEEFLYLNGQEHDIYDIGKEKEHEQRMEYFKQLLADFHAHLEIDQYFEEYFK
jgi:hypothetical protein